MTLPNCDRRELSLTYRQGGEFAEVRFDVESDSIYTAVHSGSLYQQDCQQNVWCSGCHIYNLQKNII